MSQGPGQLAARLAHDVGKYISRAARNLPTGAAPPPLVEMLIKDLFATDGKRPATVVFEERAMPLELVAPDPRLGECRERLGEIDRLEPAIRKAEQDAISRAAELALEIESRLRSLARDLIEAGR